MNDSNNDNATHYTNSYFASIKRDEYNCASCAFWRPYTNDDSQAIARGRCVFGAPNYSLVMAQNSLGGNPAPVVVTYWRETMINDACSDWEMVGGEASGFIVPPVGDASM
jgi:hypothetical protein